MATNGITYTVIAVPHRSRPYIVRGTATELASRKEVGYFQQSRAYTLPDLDAEFGEGDVPEEARKIVETQGKVWEDIDAHGVVSWEPKEPDFLEAFKTAFAHDLSSAYFFTSEEEANEFAKDYSGHQYIEVRSLQFYVE